MKEGLHLRRLLVATGGFPNRAVLSLLSLVMPHSASWLHWGDTDLPGIRIARVLKRCLGRTPEFFRCGGEDVRRFKARLIPLSVQERKDMAADLKGAPSALGSSVLRADLAEGGWLEQEAWEPSTDRSSS